MDTTDKVGELEALLARLDERTDGDYLARLENGALIASECADFLSENGPELLRIYRAWQGAEVCMAQPEPYGGSIMYGPAELGGQRVRLLPDQAAA